MAGIFIPSDLYYADLYDSDGAFDDWDADADGYYGEHGISSNCATNRYLVNIDHVDLHPDIAVGRVPASTLEEIEGYVAKVIKYEYLAASAPFDWFHTVLLIAGKGPDCDPGIHFDDIEQTLGSEPGFNVTTYIDNRYYDTGGSDEPYRPCTCTDSETHEQCLTRTLLLRPSALEVLANAIHWNHESTLDATIVANAGFLGWHDHTMSVGGAPVGTTTPAWTTATGTPSPLRMGAVTVVSPARRRAAWCGSPPPKPTASFCPTPLSTDTRCT